MPISQISEVLESNFHEIFLVDNTRSLFGLPPNFDALQALARTSSLPILFGGGISTLDHALTAFELGASRLYINTALESNPMLPCQISNICGRQALCGGIEYRNDFNYSFQCFSEAGREPLDTTVQNRIIELQHLVSEFIITSITLDGTCNGLDYNVLEVLNKSDIESVLTLCGGITPDSFSYLESFSSNLPQLTGVAMSTFPLRVIQ